MASEQYTVLPDPEYILLEVLRRRYEPDYRPDAAKQFIHVRIPADLYQLLDSKPVIVAYKTGGKAPAPGFVDNSMFTISVYGRDRMEASYVARCIREWLQEACTTQERVSGAYGGNIAYFREISGPQPTEGELVANQPIQRFVTSVMVATKP